MNKKLKELIEQATVNRGRMRVVDIEILAELIIRECSSIVRQCRFAPDEDAIAHEIEQHFGIDETVEHCPTCNEPWSGTSCGLDNCGWITGGQGEE